MDVHILSSSAYNSDEKKKLIDEQSQMTFKEKLAALQDMQNKQKQMSDKEIQIFILKEWKAFQKKSNGLDIVEEDYDLSDLDFNMSIYDFAQYGFLKSENIIDDYYNYIPFNVDGDGVGHYDITLKNCNKKLKTFGQIVSIFAGGSGPYPETLKIK